MKLKITKKTAKPTVLKKEMTGKVVSIIQEQACILNDESSFAFREAYNALRTNIIFSIPKDGCKIVGITSSERSEGKSINTLNMAINIAESNARVLLIDCDLRKPKISRLLDVKSSPGVSNVLVGLNDVTEIVRTTKYANLHILLSGDIPPNPTELLGTDKFGDMLNTLSDNYDFILIDTPPVNAVADASIISKNVEGFIFVVRQDISERDGVTHALEQLKFIEAKVLGFLLNSVTQSKGIYRRKYKKYSYGYEYYGID